MELRQIKARCIEEGDCWLWKGGKNSRGQPKVGRRSGRRLVWELVKGPVPPEARMGVSCGCPSCLNPKHLTVRTRAEVTAEVLARPSVKRKRSASGARAMKARAKLDFEKARYIRESDKTQTQLARELGVSQPLISRVRLYQGWVEHESPFAGLMA